MTRWRRSESICPYCKKNAIELFGTEDGVEYVYERRCVHCGWEIIYRKRGE